jgi:hypothetical protein
LVETSVFTGDSRFVMVSPFSTVSPEYDQFRTFLDSMDSKRCHPIPVKQNQTERHSAFEIVTCGFIF